MFSSRLFSILFSNCYRIIMFIFLFVCLKLVSWWARRRLRFHAAFCLRASLSSGTVQVRSPLQGTVCTTDNSRVSAGSVGMAGGRTARFTLTCERSIASLDRCPPESCSHKRSVLILRAGEELRIRLCILKTLLLVRGSCYCCIYKTIKSPYRRYKTEIKKPRDERNDGNAPKSPGLDYQIGCKKVVAYNWVHAVLRRRSFTVYSFLCELCRRG